MSGTIDLREMAATLSSLKKKVNDSTPQLVHSSIEGGALAVMEGDQVAAYLGLLPDGTYGAVTVAGPNPPVPDGFTIEPVPGGAKVRWGGTWESLPTADGLAPTPTVAPMDFAGIEVHASTDPGLSALLFDTFKTRISSPRGGEVLVSLPRDTDFYFRFIARSTAGKVGAPSSVIGPLRAGKAIESDLDIDWTQVGGNKIYYGPDEPPAGSQKAGDIWLKIVDATAVVPTYIIYQWQIDLETSVITGWVPLADQGSVDAALAAEAAQTAANNKLRLFTSDDQPPDLGPTDHAMWLEPDNGNRSYFWDGDTMTWSPRTIGNGAISPGTLVASDVLATGSITAALFEAVLVLATTIAAGPLNGTHAELSPTGLRVFVEDPIDGVPNEIARFGVPGAGDVFGITNTDGMLVASISQNGALAAQSAAIATTDFTIAGVNFADYIGNRSTVIAWAQSATISAPGITTERSLGEIAYDAVPGTLVKLTVSGLRWASSSVGGFPIFRLRNPVTNTVHKTWQMRPADTSVSFVQDSPVSYTYITGGSGVLPVESRLMVTIQTGGAGSIHFQTSTTGAENLEQMSILVESFGPAPSNVYANNPIETSGTAVPVKQYDQLFAPSWSACFKGDGTIMTNAGTNLYQGQDPSGFNGNERSMVGWGTQATTALTGATLKQALVYLYANHWYANSGGTLVLGSHSASAKPATYAAPGASYSPNRATAAYGNPQGRWLDVTAWDWKGGTVRGVIIGPGPNTSSTYYGRFAGNGGANPPILRLIYTK